MLQDNGLGLAQRSINPLACALDNVLPRVLRTSSEVLQSQMILQTQVHKVQPAESHKCKVLDFLSIAVLFIIANWIAHELYIIQCVHAYL